MSNQPLQVPGGWVRLCECTDHYEVSRDGVTWFALPYDCVNRAVAWLQSDLPEPVWYAC